MDNSKLQGRVIIAQLDNGRYIAASTHSPYFCFHGTSEENALEKARRALAIYIEYKQEVRAPTRAVRKDIYRVTDGRSYAMAELAA
jgi:predicted RNase H-like HicB family nuclease